MGEMNELHKLLHGRINADEAESIIRKLIKQELKIGDLVALIEVLHDYEVDGKCWAHELKKQAIRKLKKIEPRADWEKRYIQKIIKEYSR
jgi:hypothetical protein